MAGTEEELRRESGKFHWDPSRKSPGSLGGCWWVGLLTMGWRRHDYVGSQAGWSCGSVGRTRALGAAGLHILALQC